MKEPEVTLTDYALAIECAVFCALAIRWRASSESLRRWWVVFFGSIGLASLLGGTVHGFFGEGTTGNAILWPATILAIGVTSMATWNTAAYVQLREPARSWVRRAAIALFVPYAAIVLFVNSDFLVAIVAYLPATLFLLVAMLLAYRRARERALAAGVAGLVLTFVAAAVQQLRVAVHPTYFNHNALYHVIQAVALLLIFIGARQTTVNPSATVTGSEP